MKKGAVQLGRESGTSLVGNSPVVEPLHVLVLSVVAGHTPADGEEVDVEADDDGVQKAVDDDLEGVVAVSHKPVNQEAKGENGKVESRVIMVHIGDTGHNNKGKIVEEPAGKGVQSRVVDVVDLVLVEIVEATLPPKDVPDNDQTSNTERGSRTPVDKRVAEEEVLDDVISPTAHAETDMEDRPLPPLGGKVILLVRVGDQSVVGGHHGNVQVNKVVEEGRPVDTSLGRGD